MAIIVRFLSPALVQWLAHGVRIAASAFSERIAVLAFISYGEYLWQTGNSIPSLADNYPGV